MVGILDWISGNNPQKRKSEFTKIVSNLPPAEQTWSKWTSIAEEVGVSSPADAAEWWAKQYDAQRKRISESLPGQPTGTVPLDVPLAQKVKDVAGLNYLQPAPIGAPLGMQGDLPMGIEDLLASLPQDFQLPSPIQGQQPALSFFGPQALSELPQQVTQPYIPSDVSEKVMSALTRQPDITSFPSGTETRTVLRDPVTGLPMGEDIATAPRQILTPQQAAFNKLTPAEQKEALLKADVEIKMPSPTERKELVETGKWQDMLGNYKAAYDNAKSSLGPAVGRVKYLQYLKGGGYGLSPSEITFFANEATVTNRIIQLITGAAVGVEEEKRIRSEIPSHTDTPAQWEVKYKATLKNATDLENRIIKTMKDYGIGSPTNKPTGTIEWQQ